MSSWLDHMIWLICVTLTLICVIILMIVLYIHTYNVVTISYVGKRDTINRITTILTFISSICSTGVIALQLMLWFAILIEYCYPLQLTLALLWNPAKLFMQLVFLMNLHFVYKQTLYRYNPICLLSIGIALTIIYNLLLLWTCVTLQISPLRLSNGIGMRCNAHSGVVCALVVMGVDVVCSIGFVVAFTRPIRRMVRDREHGQTPASSTHKVLYTQTKVMVLVGTASVSTLILLLSIRIIPPIGWPTLTALVYVLVPADQVVNVISLILLAQYYDNKKCFSYETVCCCVVACCRCICACGINPTHSRGSIEIPTGSTCECYITESDDTGYTRTLATGSPRLEMTATSLLDVDIGPVAVLGKDGVSSFDAHPSTSRVN